MCFKNRDVIYFLDSIFLQVLRLCLIRPNTTEKWWCFCRLTVRGPTTCTTTWQRMDRCGTWTVPWPTVFSVFEESVVKCGKSFKLRKCSFPLQQNNHMQRALPQQVSPCKPCADVHMNLPEKGNLWGWWSIPMCMRCLGCFFFGHLVLLPVFPNASSSWSLDGDNREQMSYMSASTGGVIMPPVPPRSFPSGTFSSHLTVKLSRLRFTTFRCSIKSKFCS